MRVYAAMKKPFQLVMLALGIHTVQAQNLVPNPSFEEYTHCPGTLSQSPDEFRVPHWSSATFGTPDHFHSCSGGEADVPHNWAGVSEAYEGNGYAGIYLWMGLKTYREYLECRLLQPLIKDTTYHIEFHYRLSSYSKYSINRVGLLLSESEVRKRHDEVLKQTPTLSVVQDSALTRNTGLWEKASIDYKALGNEQYLVIGNFFDDAQTRYYDIQFRPIQEPMLASGAYYYIDDVSVVPAYIRTQQIAMTPLPAFSLPEADLNTTYVLQNIRFEFNSARLTYASFDELDQVVEYLKRFPKVHVQLSGHTDDQGNEAYNLRLSRSRAQSAAAYLVASGITSSRVETFGYGESKPLVNDISEQARSVNRRVEIRFFE
jgi:outer membrane protein OmpA-like peptidoglycan-associated protein